MRFVAGGQSHIGLVRKTNEDAWAVTDRLAVVADGLGGHAAGEVASRIAVDWIVAVFAGQPTAAGLVAAVRTAHEKVLAAADADPGLYGMATTVCALALTDDVGPLLVNVGDSRAYGIDDDDAVLLTWDDTLVFERVAEGALTLEQAERHPNKNIVTQAVGLPVDLRVATTRPAVWPERLVLATDGLSDMVPADTIGWVAASHHAAQDAAAALVDCALHAGGRDNVTVIVADLAA